MGGCTGCGAGTTGGGGGGCVAAAAAAAAAFWADFSRARALREGFFSSTAFGTSFGTFLGLSGPPLLDPDASRADLGRAAGRDGLPPRNGKSGISPSLDDASDAVALGEGDRVVVGTLLPFGFARGLLPRGVRPVRFSLAFRSRSSSARSRATASSACRSACGRRDRFAREHARRRAADKAQSTPKTSKKNTTSIHSSTLSSSASKRPPAPSLSRSIVASSGKASP